MGDTEAVTEPDLISDDTKASNVKAERGISNKRAPLPLNDEPEFISIPPLTNNEPLKREPNSTEVTTNPIFGATEAVTLPLAIKVAVNAGILNN